MADALAKHDRIIKVLTKTVERTPEMTPQASENLYNLGKAKLARFKDSKVAADIDEASTLLEKAARIARDSGSPGDQARYISATGDVLLARYDSTHQKADLTKAHEAYSKAYKAMPDSPWSVDPAKALHAANLAKVKEILGDRQSLEEAWDLYQTAYRVETLANLPSQEQKWRYVLSIPEVSMLRFKAYGESNDLQRALTGAQQARFEIPENHPLKPAGFRIFARASLEGHKRFGSSLQEAIDASKEALRRIPEDDPDSHSYFSMLGETRYAQYELSKDEDDLEDACRAFAEAVNRTPKGNPAKAEYRNHLDNAYVALISTGRDVDDQTIITAVDEEEAVEGITENLAQASIDVGSKTATPGPARKGSQGNKPLRVLSLDGGGVRGLSSLIVLRRIMRQLRLKLDPDSDDDDNAPLLPCDHFDLICGTSTGGIIAIMLGRLRMSVDECIDTYIKFSREIFVHEKSFAGVRKLAGGAQYVASTMEEKMKAIIKLKTGDAEAKMKDPLKKECCKTFVVATARDYADAPPFKLRTYSTEEFPADNCTIWQAARATSAATTFFDPVTFGVPKVTYIDGALGGHNNPVKLAIDESKDIWPNRQLGCLLSIGTGKPDITAVTGNLASIAEACVKLHMSCEAVDDEMYKEFTRPGNVNPYFRFSVDRGLGNVVLDEWEKEEEMAAITEAYLKYSVQANRARQCVQALAVTV